MIIKYKGPGIMINTQIQHEWDMRDIPGLYFHRFVILSRKPAFIAIHQANVSEFYHCFSQ